MCDATTTFWAIKSPLKILMNDLASVLVGRCLLEYRRKGYRESRFLGHRLNSYFNPIH